MPFDLLDVKAAVSDAVKAHTVGTHRIMAPERTLERVAPFLPVMGITRVANVTGLDAVGIPVVMVTRPNSRSISVSQGKGVTLAAAKASGVMESIESYHAERITLPLKFASYEELRWTHPVVDVGRLPRLATGSFNPHSPILWIEGQDLLNGGPKWVPFEMVHLNFTMPMAPGHGAFLAGSNGLASGNHKIEAISHAITELVERDATTLWRLAGEDAQSGTRIDLDSVDDPVCRSLIDRFEAAGVAVGVWEITSDVGLPAFLCRIVEREELPQHSVRPASGMGCHAAREIALSRALTEAAQSRLTFIAGARDDMPRAEYERHLDPGHHARWKALIVGGSDGGSDGAPGQPSLRRSFRTCPTSTAPTIEADLAHQLDRLRAVGIDEAVAVDLTKPEFGIPVVRVVVPGLEGADDSPDYLLGDRGLRALGHPITEKAA
ncbi:YcaO-like family protein [Azospirillum picis]|uniref:Ribosomal protein S12 methylthiotransferase accessory factor n=1 Tax=Azospirillum picis TaxID=488438 RepID=A0ABU0MCT5_9PROT|nr:YcaO-like family protein [Azospirillum picis]MBP2297744.1 ribosomal protein S12 methylthiotransferase accessory factor [Azospirillum picis]MDQ0531233.1 ribosomal protein S12 methylthiotransferase accessory factor [Azospirillum picis]